MHTATRLGARLAERVRALNPAAHIAFYGLYASLHADVLVGRLGDSAIGGEYEGPLVRSRMRWTSGGDWPSRSDRRAGRPDGSTTTAASSSGGRRSGCRAATCCRRSTGTRRSISATHQKLAGYVEASRGCAHRCLHCPITPVYGGRLRIVERDVVLEDIEQLVRLGAEHITFGDPDFFNGIRHSLRIVEELHAAFPTLTYDATIKVEHLLEHREHLRDAGADRAACSSSRPSRRSTIDVLAAPREGPHGGRRRHGAGPDGRGRRAAAPDLRAVHALDRAGRVPRAARLRRGRGLIRHVDAVQYAIRLLVPRGSSLWGRRRWRRTSATFDPETFSYRWRTPTRAWTPSSEMSRRVGRGGDARRTRRRSRSLARIERLADRRRPA